jgi:hypothetical protein
MSTLGECAYFSDNAYENPWGDLAHNLQEPWRRMQFPIDSTIQDNPFTGFRAHVYHSAAKKKVVIAFAGTDPADRLDRKAC